ncbi:MAG: FAD-dependent oxidoreductase [Gammaproteobacteria bacterium]|nr:FAD-dependent oxidoreductase [Gammaproteobacteria bacterium]MBU6509185.1 FAD-dependent oxidoreductase [Gammaproteobacteria bacterium]MDE1984145.1 FAD-dependent oxidoreductase [Gammaproteobacteria bacterium]MDE2108402.1 FAD-dependent oxidoreductase [Gammaproteobacteria bacterium]
MRDFDFDLVIVGAGIHGAGIAQAAAAAGHSVLVLERQTIAAGTSSRSSKLVHGGLRYLEQFDIKLVRESLVERERLLQLAPALVKLVPFYIPIYRSTRRRPWEIRVGLSLYALLGGLHTHARFRSVPRRRWDELNGLGRDGLQAVFQYWDAQTDDAALTRAVMSSALSLGAQLSVNSSFTQAEIDELGCTLTFSQAREQRSLRCRVLVNAAGPWVNQVADRITPTPVKAAVDLVQGTHLVMDKAIVDGIFYVEAPSDGRAVFIMPWHEHSTLVGTTETLFKDPDPATVRPLAAEQDYLLAVLRRYFPLASTQIRTSFAGLRVLPRGSKRAFRRSREILLLTDRPQRPRLLSVYGGKLTSYRADAARALRLIRTALPARPSKGDTRSLPLTSA